MRRSSLLATAIALAAVSGSSMAAGQPTAFGRFRQAFEAACRSHQRFDRNGDGIMEIEALRPIASTSGKRRGCVLVAVEERLWQAGTAADGDLQPYLRRFVADISRDGFHAGLAVVRLHASHRHQDGETVLALRRWVQTVYARAPDLKALVLVGHFPAPFLVRQYFWRRTDGLTLHAGLPGERKWNAVPHVRSIAEVIAMPGDIVLADLDGNWEEAYRRLPERLGGLLAAFPDDPRGEVSDVYQHTAERYEDFFIVQDGLWEETAAPDGKRRFTFPGERNAECSTHDLRRVNVLAQPEIAIGRINARHAAIEPNPDIKGLRGEGLLDAQGRPQTVEFAGPDAVPPLSRIWVSSETLERRLLKAYFDRNHAYRTAVASSSWLPASITTEWDSSVPDMKAGVPGWRDASASMLDVRDPKATVGDFAAWMMRPALARAIKAHAGPTGFGFEPPASFETFASDVGPSFWWWTREGSRLVPDPRPLGGWVNYGLLRSLYENRKLSGAPAFYLHTGCEGMQPANFAREPYNSGLYGQWQIAEALLMLGDGLALVGRGKVFYDEPREFWKCMGEGGTFGDAWRRYFDVESADAQLAADGIGRKRAYFWSVIGDCTLSLPETLRTP